MTPQQFISKWQRTSLSERSACQQHFLDLCDLLGQPKPAEADPDGAYYTFERGVEKTGGGKGWADVWYRERFGWEYKGKHKDLAAAYQQLLQYREDLENPPLLIVCDMDRFEVHTNFTGTVKTVHAFDLEGLSDPKNLDVLRKVFTDPQSLKPGQTPEGVTRQAAELIGQIADGMRTRAIPAPDAAHFLMKLMFCMFAEDIGLLKGHVFQKILETGKDDPPGLANRMEALFTAMCEGGYFGADRVDHFNGGLFADADVIELKRGEIQKLSDVNRLDWSSVEPSVFGTLFERTLDPDKRSQIGAHYTSREDIETLLEPVVMQPLRREWEEVRAKCESLLPKIRTAAKKQGGPRLPSRKGARPVKKPKESKARRDLDKALHAFTDRLAHVTILDPACGSGNFLYVALHLLLDLEKEVISYAARQGVGLLPQVRPTQLAGIEINPYAQELASVVIWIGYLQWMRHNGFNPPSDPILEPIETIRLMDAILDLSDPEHPAEPEWPEAEFIVGNPPFLGNRFMAAHYEGGYLESLYRIYQDRMGGKPDLCCYWFEKARSSIQRNRTKRAGLLATQGIRGGTNRNVLKRIKQSGDIFFAIPDREWLLDGAMVHVSLVGFDNAAESARRVNGTAVTSINSDLTSGTDITQARSIDQNRAIAFQGGIKRGSFDISDNRALEFLRADGNPHGRPNSDVILPYANATDVTRTNRGVWIIHFGKNTPIDAAALYSAPFAYLESTVKPERATANQASARENWWLHWNVREQLEESLSHLDRWIVTPRVSKHRVFAWAFPPTYVDNALVAFAKDDDYTFGLLHSRIHEVWARAQGTQLRERESGFRYTPTTCFETFPFPEATEAQREAIADAACKLNQLRSAWLSPPEWTRTDVLEFPGSVDGPWKRYIDGASVERQGARGVGTVRYPRIVAKDEDCAKRLRKRTLTNLYNERPTWLELAHRKLDEAVFAAYGWDAGMGDEELLEKLLGLNLERAGA
ncbi:MAG: class I SAM-dependent DNA methyltransferase [Planctomycetota bacterium]|nr:MAG: class I SAM-dependent DNA methyltransferase [Planctomycetota bacterium]REK24357.1 MAG: class I SAM-dependent DNA methyltransferase [Planctomycetota bacterium]REK38548.1 MAG: class I SAM-dependent DNA methyltransferase [Planctomycetota bacterium]